MDTMTSFEQFIHNQHVQCGILVLQIVLILAILFVRVRVHKKKIKKVFSQYKKGEYDKIISIASQLKNGYALVGTKRSRHIYNQLSLILASSSLRLGNDELFHKHIKDISDVDLEYVALMWLTVFDLDKNDMVSAMKHYEQFLKTQEDDRKIVAKTFLDALFAYKENSRDLAVDLITEIREKVENPVMNDYMKDITNRKS